MRIAMMAITTSNSINVNATRTGEWRTRMHCLLDPGGGATFESAARRYRSGVTNVLINLICEWYRRKK
jgi:hypothetical protein